MSSARRGFGQHSPGKLVCASMASCTVHHKKSPDRSRIPVDIPTGWEPPWPYGLHLLIFPQPLGRALKNQNAAPTTPPCFCRRQRSSSLLFESCTVHHTVRTRTRFFTKKGSGMFFVYRRFCGRTTRNGKRAKAGYHYDSGILPFALRNQVRFVRTWLSPYMTHWGNRCVRAYRESVYTSGKV